MRVLQFYAEQLLLNSGFFGWVQQEFYFSEYPDVRDSGQTAAYHYAHNGFSEGRYPNRLVKFIRQLSSILPNTPRFISGRIMPSNSGPPNLFAAARSGASMKALFIAFLWRFACRNNHSHMLMAESLKVLRLPEIREIWPVQEVEPEGCYRFRDPVIHGETIPGPVRTVPLPEKWIASVPDAWVVGGFQVVANRRLIVYEPAADPHQGFVAGTWPYVAAVEGVNSRAAIWFRYTERIELPEGILLSGRCSPNYFHWLIEYLGKAYVLAKKPELRGIPVIVDSQMFPQEFESLQAVLPDWPIFLLPPTALLRVDRLHIPSVHTYLPDSPKIPFWVGGALCTQTLKFIRDKVLSGTDDTGVRAGPGCLDSSPRILSGLPAGFAECGASRFCRISGRA